MLAGAITGTFMAFFMSAFITYINTGFDDGFVDRWLVAFGYAVVAAVPLAMFVGPHARKLAAKIAG